MNVTPHLIRLYVRTSRRYKKIISRLQRQSVTTWQRKTFLYELQKLARRLRGLQAQLRITAATGTLVLMLNAGQLQAQTIPTPTLGPFIKQDRLTNPLREPVFTNREPALAIVDFDSDGDMDIVLGENNYNYNDFGGYLRYFENQTSAGKPLYVERVDDNPFSGIRSRTSGVAPAFADIDNDGDADLLLGQNGWTQYDEPPPGGIEYYRNDDGTFSKQTGAWDALNKTGNPFDGISLGNYVRPVFVDFDKDGDEDVIIGSYDYTGFPDYLVHYIHYYRNDGSGNFASSPVTINTPLYTYNTLSPAVADLDEDGDYDILLGAYNYDELIYLQQVAPGSFDVVSGPWDPVAKTGNPFDGRKVGSNASPAFIDFNQDGHLDLLLADERTFYKYSDNIIDYFENTGTGRAEYEQKEGLDNPLGGVFVKRFASPVLLDMNADTEPDAVVGNGGYNDDATGQWVYDHVSLSYYQKNEGAYREIKDDTHPLNGPRVNGYFAPQFVDVDGDGDLDIISGEEYGQVVFFRNDDGEYVNEIELSPFAGLSVEYRSTAKLVDIDSDGDLDLFMTNGGGQVYFFEKDEDGAFVPQFGTDNPLNSASVLTGYNTPFLHFTDIDHDGDLDVFFGGISKYQRQGALLYMENTGTQTLPLFETAHEGLFKGLDTRAPQMFFLDYDKDGDLDAFVGNYDGTVSYLENQNPVVTTTVSASVAVYEPGEDDPVVVEPALTLADTDDDPIIQARVAIGDYQSGETLAFTPYDGISGVFDSETGVLTFTGKATANDYQAVLRTVTFEVVADAGGRKKSVKATTPKSITFAVYDIDFTNPEEVSKIVNVFVNSPPAIQPQPETTPSDTHKVINLMQITSDVDDNLDHTLFTIVQQPSSGATATIQVVSPTEVNLILDYTGINYEGPDQLTIRACDDAGACTESLLSIEVDVESGITVYNAIAPNSTGDNKFMRITGLPPKNKVSIFNRWGDKVFEAEDYVNTLNGNSFRGTNNDGKTLPSGTYFYKIEVPGKKTESGYLTVKQ